MNDLKKRAIACLARRDHSRAELARKLAAHGSEEEIEPVLQDLERQGLLSDARFADAYLRSRAGQRGDARLRQDLRTKGVAGELIDERLAELADELERARAVWSRKYGAAPADGKEWARQARFLQGRGFSAETIRRLLKNVEEA
ncbi:MAG TPA: recombination regulator RecX [Rhodocyclaceae bacterium]|nr:recombination regulator RecX [Rhodocyclaceae bacterium]